MLVPTTLRDVLNLTTAPFAEQAVMDYIRQYCLRLVNVRCRLDACGNLLVRYRLGRLGREPLAFAAHTDHPGFLSQKMRDPRTLEARFVGFVLTPFFRQTAVRFAANGHFVRGRVIKALSVIPVPARGPRASRPEQLLVRVEKPVEPGTPGVFDLPEPELRDGLLYAPACDDLAGVAALLELLRRLSRKRASAEVLCLFTRAEEAGFVGAIGASKKKTLPRGVPIISIEMSREIPPARIGDGPILRIGDRMSVFDPGLSAFCEKVARGLCQKNRGFRFQRRLMDGGSCESSAYAAYGYTTTGLCLALGNYHNMNEQNRAIASEYISLRDWRLLVDWLEALVLEWPSYGRGTTASRAEFERRFARHRSDLLAPKPGLSG